MMHHPMGRGTRTMQDTWAAPNRAYIAAAALMGDTQANADLAVIARIGGNEYRRRLYDSHPQTWADFQIADLDRWVRQDAENLAAGRSYRRGSYSQPWTWTDTEGGEHLTPATYHEGAHVMSPRDYSATLPEAAFDWPIIVAGLRVRYGCE